MRPGANSSGQEAASPQRGDEVDRLLQHYATRADLLELKAALRGDLLRAVVGLGTMQLLGLRAIADILRFLE